MATYQAEPIAGTRSDLGEGTLWDERRNIWVWLDVFDGVVKTLDPATGVVEDFPFPVTPIAQTTLYLFDKASGDSLTRF